MAARPNLEVEFELAEEGSSKRLVLSLPDSIGARCLASLLHLSDFTPDLAYDLAVFGEILEDAYALVQDEEYVAETREERITISKAVRLHTVIFDDGPDRYVAKHLAKQNGDQDIPANATPEFLRARIFHAADGMHDSVNQLLPSLLRDPGFFDLEKEDVDRLSEALGVIQEALAEESKEKELAEQPELRARFQRITKQNAKGCRYAARVVGYGVQVYGGDEENLRRLQLGYEKLATALEAMQRGEEDDP